MSQTVKIDFVSDIGCPWCAVGYVSLEKAIKNLGDEIQVDFTCHPFELNPHLPAGGQDILEHHAEKFGSTPEQVQGNQVRLFARGAAVGFPFNPKGRQRLYNTFDAHRLVQWAGQMRVVDPLIQRRLKRELFGTYFTSGLSLEDQRALLSAVHRAGLDIGRGKQVLDTDEFADEVRAAERLYANAGINAVPAVIFNDTYLVEGAQSVERFEIALRQYSKAE